ncbi:hypothetical protein [Paenibacillus sp. GYB003]|uniref:hypothetical protein n=1 Tax=Paenibacillus sp. GYB003 TaxID=2994392 RepID=UPI002F96464D
MGIAKGSPLQFLFFFANFTKKQARGLQMKPLLNSIDPKCLPEIQPGDFVVFRLINGEQLSGMIATAADGTFTFVGRGVHLNVIEIARIEFFETN